MNRIRWDSERFRGGHISPEEIRAAVADGADVNSFDNGNNPGVELPLQAAQTAEQTKVLLELGADVNARGDGTTALHTACLFGVAKPEQQIEQIKLLLAAGADVNARAGKYSADYDDYGSVEYSPSEISGFTPLHCAAVSADLLRGSSGAEKVKLLLDAGADINARNDKGETPLQCAEAAEKRNRPCPRGDIYAEAIGVLREAEGRQPLLHDATPGSIGAMLKADPIPQPKIDAEEWKHGMSI